MKELELKGLKYKIPNGLSNFQKDLYVHLINWKWKYITKQAGVNGAIEYDAILPASYIGKFPMIYPDAVLALGNHLLKFPFRIHVFFNHMASSQAANINLFLPILLHPLCDAILSKLKPDFKSLDRTKLDNGFRIEYWDEGSGNLGDKNKTSGTDSDIAIAYINHENEECLWLIEHKLTEAEFTECGGYKSNGRQDKHDCSKSFSDIIDNKNICYYHDVRKFEYWNITDTNKSYFVNHAAHTSCPFQKGMNQLWRNQLMGLAIETDSRQPYKHVCFSVVHHPDNTALNHSIAEYKKLIDNNPKFSVFTSSQFIDAASVLKDASLNKWIDWYKELYKL